MNTITIIGQVVGLLAAAVMIFSFQLKENKKLFTAQVISTSLFTLHYMFLGLGGDYSAYSGMAQNFGGLLLRVVLLLSEKFKKFGSPVAMAVVCSYCAVTSVLTYNAENPLCILPMVGNLILAGAMFTKNPNAIRLGQLSVTSPCWLIYNFSVFSISGIITESFNIISIAIYYVRQYVKKKKEKEKTNEKSEDNGPGQL